MISDIETILTAFAGNWKPGIEEQSIRMAHAVALQGDAATASSILRFIAIPEPMKMQILGASLQQSPPATAVNPVDTIDNRVSAETLLTATPARQMPAPLMSDSGASGPSSPMIPTVAEIDVNAVPPVPATPPAFTADLTDSVANTGTEAEPVVVSADTVQTPVLPSTPVGSLPFQRQQLFDAAFATVQSTTAAETSKPMIKDADNIPVIHTYAEPEISVREKTANETEAASKGIKLFQTLNTALNRALTFTDFEHRVAATRPWDRLNVEFPDYKTLHASEWNSMKILVDKLQDPTTVPAIVAQPSEVSVAEPTPMPVFTPDPVATASVTPTPVVAGGGYFARKVSTTESSTDPAAEVLPESPAQSIQEQVTTLDSTVLLNGVTVNKNMTITGDSIYRVDAIRQTGPIVVHFTDEIHGYTVPVDALSQALDNPDTQPDEFFKKYADK